MTHSSFCRSRFILAPILLAGLCSGVAMAQGVGTNYCTSSANSAGPGAVMSASGSSEVFANNLLLRADALPTGQFGMFFYGGSQTSLPFGNGVLCISGGLYRLKPAAYSGSTGVITHAVDISAPPMAGGEIFAGSTWNFQAWYRDGAAGGSGYNFSDGLEVTFTWAGPPYGDMALVPAGSFVMGDHNGSGNPSEQPLHTVTLSAFYMDVYEVTNQKYADYLNQAHAAGLVTVFSGGLVFQAAGAGQALCDTTISTIVSRITWNGSSFGVTSGKETHPMIQVSWYGAATYCNWRSAVDGLVPCYDETSWVCDFTASGYRLPTESEWEYAARGGYHSPYLIYPWGNTLDGSHANYWGSGDPWEGAGGPEPETSPVGYYDGNQIPAGVDMANGYGLYDMSGNVWEWCGDWYGSYPFSAAVNPTGPATGSGRVVRGGSWLISPFQLRSANRIGYTPSNRNTLFGFRVLAVRP